MLLKSSRLIACRGCVSAIAEAEAELATRPPTDPTRRKPVDRPALTLTKPGTKRKADGDESAPAGKKAKEDEDEDDEEEDEDEDESEDEEALTEACELAEEGLGELKEALREAKAARLKIEKAVKKADKVPDVDKKAISASGWRPFVTKVKKLEGEAEVLKLCQGQLDKWAAALPPAKKSKK